MTAKPIRIDVCKVEADLEALLAPDAEAWTRAGEAAVPVEPTPLERLPSAYVQEAWRGKPRSGIRELRVRAVASADALAIRIDWLALRPSRLISDVNVYPDGCAVVFPLDAREADFSSMGSPKHPVQAWHWRAGTEPPFVVTATGIGTTERAPEHEVRGRARWADGRWQVVLARPLAADGVPLGKRATLPVGFAVWSGAARERAGVKSFSAQACELRLGSVGGGKR